MNNHDSYQEAAQVLAGGVNSPVRSFAAVGGEPIFIDHAKGAYLHDVESKKYIDYVCSWGAIITGHANKRVTEAIADQAGKGASYGAPCELETELAQLICRHMPGIEKIRMVNSGTEATMTALRLARGHTGRDGIVKFEGCYHGHSDALLVKAGSGVETLGLPDSPGVPKDTVRHTSIVPYNDIDAATTLLGRNANKIAAVIVEPIAGNMGMILPQKDFLKELRELCDQHGITLILDEVMTGFRVALGGAGQHYGIEPDLTTLGKVIGGGLPIGALGGKREIMDKLAPTGPVYQAGPLAGNPLAMAAGIAAISQLSKETFTALQDKTETLTKGLRSVAAAANIPMQATALGGMFGFSFSQKRVDNLQQAKQCNNDLFRAFFHAMCQRGVYLAPSPYEAGFITTAHSDQDIADTIAAAAETLNELGENK